MSKVFDYSHLVGKVYERLEVIGVGCFRKGVTRQKRNYLLCLCDCGIPCYVTPHALEHNKTGSCGCLQKDRVSDANTGRISPTRQSFGEAYLRNMFNGYRRAALDRDKEFHLHREEFLSLICLNCHYCGTPPTIRPVKNRYYGVPSVNGLDRRDNNKGYFLDNVIPCCSLCNYAKKELTYDEFISWLDRIAVFRTGKPDNEPKSMDN